MSVYGMSRMVATSMGSTTTTAVRLRACCSLGKKVYQSGSGASTPDGAHRRTPCARESAHWSSAGDACGQSGPEQARWSASFARHPRELLSRVSFGGMGLSGPVDYRCHLRSQELDAAQHLLVRQGAHTHVQLESLDAEDFLPANDLGGHGLDVADDQ